MGVTCLGQHTEHGLNGIPMLSHGSGRVSGVGVRHFPGAARSAWSSGYTHVTDETRPRLTQVHRTLAGTAKASVSSREPAS